MLNRHNIRKKLVFAVYQEYVNNPLFLQKSNILQTFSYYCNESNHILGIIIDLIKQIRDYSYVDISYKQQIKQPRKLQQHSGISKLRSQQPMLENPKFSQNKAILYLTNQLHKYRVKCHENTGHIFDEDMIKRLFYTIIKNKKYKEYELINQPQSEHEFNLIKFIVEDVIMQDKTLEELLELNFLMAYEDAQVACIHILKTLNNWMINPENSQSLFVDISQYEEFAQVITEILIREYDTCQKIIFPKIQHWDEHRICSLDKILLILGLCEILYYEKVPVRVVINEYIEIAKEYSTEKSKNFINGILDSILKDLIAMQKIPQNRL